MLACLFFFLSIATGLKKKGRKNTCELFFCLENSSVIIIFRSVCECVCVYVCALPYVFVVILRGREEC